MTIHEFMAQRAVAQQYIKEPGFRTMLVRRSYRQLEGVRYDVLTIRQVTALKKGRGFFRAFLTELRLNYPRLTVYVEAVLTRKFWEGLQRMGFRHHRHSQYGGSWYIRPDDPFFLQDVGRRRKMVAA